MNVKINTDLPVCLSDGRKARIVCTDRDYTDYPIIALIRDVIGVEQVWAFRENGTTDTDRIELMNQFVYDGLQQGMKLNPGYKPDDWDESRPCTSFGGVKNVTGIGRWSLNNRDDDIVLYWPKPEIAVTLDLTLNEAEALAKVLRQVGGDPTKTARKHIQSIQQKMGGLAEVGTHLETYSNAFGIYFET